MSLFVCTCMYVTCAAWGYMEMYLATCATLDAVISETTQTVSNQWIHWLLKFQDYWTGRFNPSQNVSSIQSSCLRQLLLCVRNLLHGPTHPLADTSRLHALAL